MLELILHRVAKREDYTIGSLYFRRTKDLDFQPWVKMCDTLEPHWVDFKNGGKKVRYHTAIPEGRYSVVITHSPKFNTWLPLLCGVPNFSNIRIHPGNIPQDTHGCILVGRNTKVGQLTDSQETMKKLMKFLNNREEGEPIFIRVENNWSRF